MNSRGHAAFLRMWHHPVPCCGQAILNCRIMPDAGLQSSLPKRGDLPILSHSGLEWVHSTECVGSPLSWPVSPRLSAGLLIEVCGVLVSLLVFPQRTETLLDVSPFLRSLTNTHGHVVFGFQEALRLSLGCDSFRYSTARGCSSSSVDTVIL